MEVICSNLKCKYMNDKGKCTCKKIELSLNGIHTLNQGYQDFLRCNSFKKDEEYSRLEKKIKELLVD